MIDLQRLLRNAIVRQDRVAELNIRARIASVPFRDVDESYAVWVPRAKGKAA